MSLGTRIGRMGLASSALVLALAACSDDGDGGGGPSTDAGETDAGTDATIDAPPDVTQKDAAPEAAPPDAPTGDLGEPLLVDLGTVTAGTAVELVVPEGVLGFHVVVRRAAGGAVGVERITSPSGQDVVVDFTVEGFSSPTTLGQSGVGAATVPQNALSSAMPLETGAWKLVLGGAAAGEALTAKAWIQTSEDGAFHGGQLDLNVYVPEGLELADGSVPQTVTAATAPTHSGLKTRLDTFYDALGALFGIGRGEVRFKDIAAEHRLLTSFAGLDAAFSATALPENVTALHLVLANDVSLFSQPVWGISSAIPGGAVESGHPVSGIALNVSLGFSAYADGWTMLHELGHFAGLFHSTDPGGSDPLPDTPECTSYPSACPDGKNIMFAAFWGASGGTGILASDQQRAVVRGSPLYRAYLNSGEQQRWVAPPLPPERDIARELRSRNIARCSQELLRARPRE